LGTERTLTIKNKFISLAVFHTREASAEHEISCAAKAISVIFTECTTSGTGFALSKSIRVGCR
jgi:hypothetical protein